MKQPGTDGEKEGGDRGVIGSVVDNLSWLFRYVLPGVVVLGAARASHPWWFSQVNFGDPWHLLGLAVAAVVAGNLWYGFHRYAVHQAIEAFLYAAGFPGPSDPTPELRALLRFNEALSRYVVRAHHAAANRQLRDHVALRAASIHLLYIASEAAFFFAVWWPNKESFFGRNRWEVLGAAVIFFFFAAWQQIITRRIDYYRVEGIPR